MPKPRTRRLLCLTCSLPMTRDDREHYGYACHACVVREHELTVTLRSDPDHPDLWRLSEGPVHLGYRRREAQE
ncbi:hypothetical protein [Enterovirga aerilata]|uniref:Uncharacterized protein n=1 Tax=Enterovirga aerilata TaxID=2730920 RepID=A0A849I9H5_9HYPH|nr:hypothetical protein [Enterovirga sp. DB1703]NNM74474.1 hypothetical protein [Enterovirga sp. DB1703]